jgi:holin (3TMs family)
MPLPIIGSVLELGKTLIERLIPDPKMKAEAMLELARLEQSGDLAAMAMQAKINEIEAANPNMLIAGWRPAVGWVCAAGLAMAYVAGPAVSLVVSIVGLFHGVPFVPPVVDMATLSPILMGMLGMAGLRTWEKMKGAEGNR